jgi:hypothetical protein
LCRETPWNTLKKANNGHKTKKKVGYFILLDFKKKSSLKIPLLHHAASFNTEAKRLHGKGVGF